MAWTQKNKTAWNSTSANTSHTTSAFPSTTAGDLIVIFVNADALITSFTSGYTQAAAGVNFSELRIYYKIAAGGETSVTFGLGNTRSAQTLTLQYGGNVASSPLDLANSATGSNTTPTTPSITTTVADTIIFAAFAGDDTHTYSALTAGYTQESDQRSTGSGGSGAEVSMLVASRILTATGAQSASITQSGVNNAWEACIAAFKMLTGGATNASVTAPAASLSLVGRVPAAGATSLGAVVAPASSLSLVGRVPTAAATGLGIVAAPASALSLVARVPSLSAGGGLTVAVPAANLSLVARVPSLSAGVAVTVAAPAALLTLMAPAPTVAATVAGTVVSRWNGSAWVATVVQRWNGSAWVTAIVKRWNGTSWV